MSAAVRGRNPGRSKAMRRRVPPKRRPRAGGLGFASSIAVWCFIVLIAYGIQGRGATPQTTSVDRQQAAVAAAPPPSAG